MCPRGARLLAGHGGLLEKTRMVAHCLLVEAGGEHVLIDTGFGTAECAKSRRLPLPFAVIAPQLRESETAIRQVEALGIGPNDIHHIVTT
jgi:glyoxylase-like metal-dependent hydrolase (beta-lactamase superfamily II)